MGIGAMFSTVCFPVGPKAYKSMMSMSIRVFPDKDFLTYLLILSKLDKISKVSKVSKFLQVSRDFQLVLRQRPTLWKMNLGDGEKPIKRQIMSNTSTETSSSDTKGNDER